MAGSAGRTCGWTRRRSWHSSAREGGGALADIGIRDALEIPQWTVLGHSSGGRIALRYARQYPERVAAVIFENPCWDFDDTERLRLPAAAAIFDEVHGVEKAHRCRELAARRQRFTGYADLVTTLARLSR